MTDGSGAGEQGTPRPRYGEYATPEEQQARIRQPDPSLPPPDAGQPPAGAPSPGAPWPPQGGQAPVLFPAARQGPSAGGLLADRVVTVALLAYGLLTVVTAIPTLVDFTAYVAQLFGVLGIDAQPSDPGSGRVWGIVSSIVLGAGWILAALLSWRRLRAGRITWWLPLVFGVGCNLVSGFLMTVPLMSDPALMDALRGVLG